jgi:hypothetical protein
MQINIVGDVLRQFSIFVRKACMVTKGRKLQLP